MESGPSRTYTASEVVRLCDEEEEFEESDDEYVPCGDFKDVSGAETLFPSELLSPSSMPFLTFTVENKYPVARDSLLNNDEDCVEEGDYCCGNVLVHYLPSVLEILACETDDSGGESDYSGDTTGNKIIFYIVFGHTLV